jgi:hypothetical protein
MKNILAVAAE